MRPIRFFLTDYPLPEDPATAREAVAAAVREKTGIAVSPAAVKVGAGGRIFLQVSPAVKSEVFIKRQEIIRSLKERFPRRRLDWLS